jgi:glycosyltransferase involved in cell wall biosynthesis
MTKSLNNHGLNNKYLNDNPDFDVIVFSHLRWDFVYQRPQHLLSRFSKQNRVFFIEEPVFGSSTNCKTINKKSENIYVITPGITQGISNEKIPEILNKFLLSLISKYRIQKYLFWYYDPMAIRFTKDLEPLAVVYDCMDELSLFKGAPPFLIENERTLFKMADVVFTGGNNLYEAKKHLHINIFAFPSSIDKEHFSSGTKGSDPEDQMNIPHNRVGFFGVIDERMDIELLKRLAERMTDTHFIIIGPVVKIDQSDLPVADNIHYLGSKPYADLPAYLANWDVAFMPFAINDSTRFISPTKTPEFLAAGIPVVSSPIHDVVHPYGDQGLVYIANGAAEFHDAIDKALANKDNQDWKNKVEEMLLHNSWDLTWSKMREKIFETIKKKNQVLRIKTSTGYFIKEKKKMIG